MLNIDITTEEKRKEVYELFSSFTMLKDAFIHYGVVRNTSNSKYIHHICDEIGFDTNLYHKKEKKYCLYCGKELDSKRDYRTKFCNSSCAAKYNNSNRTLSDETKIKISESVKKRFEKTNNKIKEEEKLTRRGFKIKEHLFKSGIKEYKCECCGISEWNGKPIVLQLHHINGNHLDNSLENLQILCPNCHSQTDNYCNKNRKKFSERKKIYCKKCGKELLNETKTHLCHDCYMAEIKKRPTKEQLIKDYNDLKAFTLIAKKYDVSVNTIKKWLIKYQIPF